MDLSGTRTQYEAKALDPNSVSADPIEQFHIWMQDALDSGASEPTAMVLSTVDGDGQPRGRNVLLRGADASGFVFYTNYGSAKARAMAINPRVSLTFWWFTTHRQVIVEGTVELVSAEQSAAYFASRPRESQLGAWASAQSSEIAGREVLEVALADVTARYAGKEVPTPPFWGGYRVVPHAIEFWQGQPDRLHDRLLYRLGDSGWSRVQLSP